MNAAELLAELREAGVVLSIDGDRLAVNAPRGTLDDSRRAALVTHKSELLGLLDAERCGRESEAVAYRWATITLIWPATSTVPCPRGKWRRLVNGEIEAEYTREELRLALAAAGVDIIAIERGQ
jgi:hypothetical protein